jgi:hypothetical protein
MQEWALFVTVPASPLKVEDADLLLNFAFILFALDRILNVNDLLYTLFIQSIVVKQIPPIIVVPTAVAIICLLPLVRARRVLPVVFMIIVMVLSVRPIVMVHFVS